MLDLEPSLLEPQSVAVFPASVQITTSKPGGRLLDAFSSDPFSSSPSSVITAPTVSSSSAGDPFDELLSIASRPQNNISSVSASFVGSTSYTQPMTPLQPNFGQMDVAFPQQQVQGYSQNTAPQIYSSPGVMSNSSQNYTSATMSGFPITQFNPQQQQQQQNSISAAGFNTSTTGNASTLNKKDENPFDLF